MSHGGGSLGPKSGVEDSAESGNNCSDRPVVFVHVIGTWLSTPGPLNTLKSQLHFFTCPPCSEVKPRDLATLANCHQCLAAARHAAYTWSRRCRARPNVETLQSCKRTACPGSGKRVRNAEIATSPPRTRLPVPPRRPARLPLLATGCVGHGLTSARAKPAHTRHASGLGTRRNHPRWR